MSKRDYTHVRLLYPEIKAMIEAGKTQREIAEYYGFKDKYVVQELLTACGLAASKSEARRLVQQGGVFVNGEKVPAIDVTFTADQLRAGLKIRKGKKVFHKATLA